MQSQPEVSHQAITDSSNSVKARIAALNSKQNKPQNSIPANKKSLNVTKAASTEIRCSPSVTPVLESIGVKTTKSEAPNLAKHTITSPAINSTESIITPIPLPNHFHSRMDASYKPTKAPTSTSIESIAISKNIALDLTTQVGNHSSPTSDETTCAYSTTLIAVELSKAIAPVVAHRPITTAAVVSNSSALTPNTTLQLPSSTAQPSMTNKAIPLHSFSTSSRPKSVFVVPSYNTASPRSVATESTRYPTTARPFSTSGVSSGRLDRTSTSPSKNDLIKILERARRRDPIGLITAQNKGKLKEFLAEDYKAAGFTTY